MVRRDQRVFGLSEMVRVVGVALAALIVGQGLMPVAYAQPAAASGASPAAVEGRNPDGAPVPGGTTEVAVDAVPVGAPAARPAESIDTSKLIPLDGSAKPGDAKQQPNESKGSTKSSFDAATSVELPEQRTATSDTWKNADGTQSVMAYDTWKYFEASKGHFEKIDSTVVADPKRPGWLRSTANEWVASFGPLSADAGDGGVEIRGKSGSAVRFAPEANAPKANGSAKRAPAPVLPQIDEISNNVVRYAEVWPGIDIVYTVTAGGVKEDIVIKQKVDATSFAFAVDGAELVAPADADRAKHKMLDLSGGLEGEFSITPTQVLDKGGRDVTLESKSTTTPEKVTRAANGKANGKASRLTVDVDPTWLAAIPADQFPIVIDPSVLNTGVYIWANWWAGATSGGQQTAWNGTYFPHKIGEQSGTMFRSALQFHHEQFFASNTQIVSAIIHVTNSSATPQIFRLYESADGCWGYGCATTAIDNQIIGSSGNLDASIPMRSWVANKDDNRLLMVTSDEAATGTYKEFSATIEFTTTLYPNPVVANPWPPNDSFLAAGTTTPTSFAADSPSPQDPENETVDYRLRIGTSPTMSDATKVYESAWSWGGARLQFTIPANTLNTGSDYWWTIISRDSYGLQSFGAVFRIRQVAEKLGYDGLGGNFGGVNTLLGSYVLQEVDEHTPTVGPSIDVTRTTNSITGDSATVWGDAFSRLYPSEWISGMPIKTARFSFGDGHVETYTKTNGDASNDWASDLGSANTLSGPTLGPWTFTRGDGTSFSFENSNVNLTTITDGFGHAVTLDRSVYGTIKARDNASTREVRYVYNPANYSQLDHVEVDSPAGGGAVWTWTYQYTAGGIWKACDPLLKCKRYEYQAVWDGYVNHYRLQEVFDRNNKRDVLLGYYANGRVQTTTDAYGNVTTFAYYQNPTTLQFVTTITDAKGKQWVHTYSPAGDLIAEQPPGLAATQYAVDPASHQRTSITDALGHVSYLYYDTKGRVVAQKNANGEKSLTVYDDAGNKIEECDARTPDLNNDNVPDVDTYCVIASYGPDPVTRKQRLIRSKSTPTSGGSRATESWTYTTSGSTPAGLIASHTSALGLITTFEYNAKGDLTATSEGTGSTYVEAEAASSNLPTGDPIGGASGGNARLYSGGWSNYMTFAPSAPAAGTYNLVLRYSAPAGTAHRKLEVNGTLVANAFTLPGTGWAWSTITIPIELSSGTNTITFTTDAATGSDNEVYFDAVAYRPVGSGGARTEYGYDTLGRQTSKTLKADPWTAGATWTYTYNQLGLKLTETGPAVLNTVSMVTHQSKTTWTYDDNRNVTSLKVEDVLGGDATRITTTAYDDMDRVVSVTDPEGGITLTKYDALGLVTYVRDAKGRWLKTTYDDRRRKDEVLMLGVVTTPETATGTRISKTEYDAAGRVWHETDAEGRIVQTTYDLADRVYDRSLINYKLDPAATPRSVVLSRTWYDAAGHPLSTYAGYSIVQGSPVTWVTSRTTSNTYDEGGRLSSSTISQAGSGVSSMKNDFTYDSAGNVTKKLTTQLTPAVPAGGQSIAEQRFDYYADSKIARQTSENGTVDLVTSFAYNPFGWLTATTSPIGNTLGANPYTDRIWTDYDALGRAVQTRTPVITVEVNGAAAAAAAPVARSGFNTFGDATHARDANGNTTVTSYDRLSRKTRTDYPSYTPPGGSAIAAFEGFLYDAVGNLDTHTDRLTCQTKYTYDDYNRVKTQTDPFAAASCATYVGGGVSSYDYDLVGNRIKTTDPTGAITEYSYDSANQVRTQKQTIRAVTVTGQTIPAATSITTYSYDDLGRLRSTLTSQGVELRSEYDVLGQEVKTASMGDPAISTDDQVGSTKRDVYSNPVVITDPMGRETRNEYDTAGRPVATGQYATNVATTPEWRSRQALDAAGRVVTSWPAEAVNIDANNPPFGYQYGYDSGGRLVSVTQPISVGRTATTTYGYDAAGNATRATYPTGVGGSTPVNETFTSANGPWNSTNWTTVTTATPSGVIDVFNNEGRFRYVNTAGGLHADAKNASHTDATLSTKVRVSAIDETWTFAWVRASTTASTSSPWAPTTGYGFGFTPAYGGVLYLHKASGGTTTSLAADQYMAIAANTTYNLKLEAIGGTVRAKIWADGATEPGWMMTGTDASPLGAGTASLYTNTWTTGSRDSTFDNVTLTTPGTGASASTWTTYTPWNQPQDTIEASTTAFPNAVDRTYTTKYNAAGLVTSQVQPGAVTVSSTYDSLGRLTQQSSGAASRVFGYDLVGRNTTINHPAGTETFVYDDRGLVVGSVGPAGNTIATYDTDGRVLTRNDPAGSHSFSWNKLNQLTTAAEPLSSTTMSYTYNLAGQATQVQYGNAPAPTRTYTYKPTGWLDTDSFKNNAGTTTMSAAYTYDKNGSVTREVLSLPGNTAAGTYDYVYDRSDRLVSFARTAQPTVVYTWDDSGNRTSATPQGGAAQTWSYDARNRIVSGPEGTYTWDARGTLDKITLGTTVTYDAAFDGLGRMTSAVSGATTNTFTYDALDRIAVRTGTNFSYAGGWLDPSAVGTMKYSRTPTGRLEAVKNGTSAALLAGLNRHGDLRWTFTTTGATSDTNVMDPFGKPITKTGTTNPNVSFQGDYTDPTTGDVWMGARWYTPGTNNFRSRDTYSGRLDNPVSLNRYTYAWANPLRFFDPDGRCPECADLADQLVSGVDQGMTAEEAQGQAGYRQLVHDSDANHNGEWGAIADRYDEGQVDTSACGADNACRFELLADRIAQIAAESGAPMNASSLELRVSMITRQASEPPKALRTRMDARDILDRNEEDIRTQLMEFQTGFDYEAYVRIVNQASASRWDTASKWAWEYFSSGIDAGKLELTRCGDRTCVTRVGEKNNGPIAYNLAQYLTGQRSQTWDDTIAAGTLADSMAAGMHVALSSSGGVAARDGTQRLADTDANNSSPPAGNTKTEVVQRWMSEAELKATQESGLVRGGRDGPHYATDSANSDPLRARQRLALPNTPEVRVDLQVPRGRFSLPTRVEPDFNMPGGGMERTATGAVPCRVLCVWRPR